MVKNPRAQARLDELNSEVSKNLHKVDDLERKLEMARDAYVMSKTTRDAFLEAVRLMEDDEDEADALPLVAARHQPQTKGKRGGRQPGSITEVWQRRLKHFYEQGAEFDAQAMTNFIRESEGQGPARSEISRILEKHVSFGYLEQAANNLFRVTDEAARRYQFDDPPKSEGPAVAGPSSISVQGVAGLPHGSPTQLPAVSSSLTTSTPVKNGSVATPAVPHEHNPKGGLVM